MQLLSGNLNREYKSNQHASVACFLLLLYLLRAFHISRMRSLINPAGGRCLRVIYFSGCGIESFEIEGVMMMTKTKRTFDYIKKVRNTWVIVPCSRVRENEMKNRKKRRQKDKKLIKDGIY
jgi:hypothetical protein